MPNPPFYRGPLTGGQTTFYEYVYLRAGGWHLKTWPWWKTGKRPVTTYHRLPLEQAHLNIRSIRYA